MLNKVILMGRLTRDPETRYIGDYKVANFSLAIDRDRKGANGERQTDFIDCAAWGRQADFAKQWFAKGMMAIVVGRLESRSWEDRDGNKRVSISVHVDEIQFGETKKARAASGQHTGGDDYMDKLAASASDTEFTPLPDDPDGHNDDVPF